MTIILVILLVLVLAGGFPRAGAYNADWGYGPVGLGTIVIVVLLILLFTGRL